MKKYRGTPDLDQLEIYTKIVNVTVITCLFTIGGYFLCLGVRDQKKVGNRCFIGLRQFHSNFILSAISRRWPERSSSLRRLHSPRMTCKSISPTFYGQLLRTQIPKAPKIKSSHQSFCAFKICGCKSCL